MEVVYICVGFMVIFLIITIAWAMYSIKKEKKIKQEGIKTQARVLGYFNQDIRRLSVDKMLGIGYIPIKRMILEFIDEHGQEHIILNELQKSSVFMKYKVGSTINISYKETNLDNLIEKIDQKYEEYYDMDTVRDEKGVEYKITDDSNKFDIIYLDRKHYNSEKRVLVTGLTFFLLVGVIGVLLGISALK